MLQHAPQIAIIIVVLIALFDIWQLIQGWLLERIGQEPAADIEKVNLFRRYSPALTALKYGWRRIQQAYRRQGSRTGIIRRVGFWAGSGLIAASFLLLAYNPQPTPNHWLLLVAGGLLLAASQFQADGLEPGGGERLFIPEASVAQDNLFQWIAKMRAGKAQPLAETGGAEAGSAPIVVESLEAEGNGGVAFEPGPDAGPESKPDAGPESKPDAGLVPEPLSEPDLAATPQVEASALDVLSMAVGRRTQRFAHLAENLAALFTVQAGDLSQGAPALAAKTQAANASQRALAAVQPEIGTRPPQPEKPPRPKPVAWQRICLAVGPLLAIVAANAAGVEGIMKEPALAVAAWLAGMACMLLGGHPKEDGQAAEVMGINRKLAFVGLQIFLLALIVRFYRIADLPLVISGDEGSAGLSALEFIDGRMNNIFRSSWFSYPSMYPFLLSLSVRWFGQTVVALRFPSAIMGALVVGATYWMGRNMFGHRPAWYACVFFAVLHFHNHFSRAGFQNAWDGLWFVLTMGNLWLGWQKEKRLPFILAGLAFGLCQYFYASARSLLILAPAWVAVMALLDWRRFVRLLPELGYFVRAALAAVLPLALFYLQYPEEYLAPMTRAGLSAEWLQAEMTINGRNLFQVILHQLSLSFRGYAHIPISAFYNAKTPPLRPAAATLGFIGAGVIAGRWRDSRAVMLALWILVFIFSGSLGTDIPGAHRLLSAAPAMALLVGLGLESVVEQLRKLGPWARLSGVIGLLLIGALVADEANFYFVNYAPRSVDMGGQNTMIAQIMSEYLQERGSEWEVHFFGYPHMAYDSILSAPFLAPHIQAVNYEQPWGSPGNPGLHSNHLIFVFVSHCGDDMEAVTGDLPGGTLHTYYYNNTVVFWLYEVVLGGP